MSGGEGMRAAERYAGKKVCFNCANFTPLNPGDPTAPEGRCGLHEWLASWPMGYWPNMLFQDWCAHGFTARTTPEGGA